MSGVSDREGVGWSPLFTRKRDSCLLLCPLLCPPRYTSEITVDDEWKQIGGSMANILIRRRGATPSRRLD